MYFGTIKDLFKDDEHVLNGILTFLAFLGVGVQQYGEKEKIKKKPLSAIEKMRELIQKIKKKTETRKEKIKAKKHGIKYIEK